MSRFFRRLMSVALAILLVATPVVAYGACYEEESSPYISYLFSTCSTNNCPNNGSDQLSCAKDTNCEQSTSNCQTNTYNNTRQKYCSDKNCWDLNSNYTCSNTNTNANCPSANCTDDSCANSDDSENNEQSTATNSNYSFFDLSQFISSLFGNRFSIVDTVPASPAETDTSIKDDGTIESLYAQEEYAVIALEVVELVNQERAAEGLAPLSIDNKLTEAANLRAQEINVSFSHTRPDGKSCFSALDQAGASYKTAGENIAIGYPNAQAVVDAWMNSPSHRDNIMNANYTRIGIGIAATTNGSYHGYAFGQFFAD